MLEPEDRAPLEGLRVIELGERVAAPYCGRLFAESGAEVIKVEPPGGDVTRRWGPFPGDEPDPEHSGLFHFLNADKRSIVLDLTRPDERETFRDLVAGADVLIESQRPADLERWGLDYASLAERNVDLVMISLTPFGQTGPYRDWKGYDLNAYHLAGTGSRYCGRPGEPPLEQGTFLADFYGAVAAAAWGLAATIGRETAGGGQHLDVATSEVLATTMVGGWNVPGYVRFGYRSTRTGVGLSGAPASILPCADGHAWVMALEPTQWKGLARVMGDPEWMHLEIFDDIWKRGQQSDIVYGLIEEWTRERSKWEVMEACQDAGCPATAIMTVEEVVQHPHLVERGFVVSLEDESGSGETMPNLGPPFRPSRSRVGTRHMAPRLDAQADEIRASTRAAPARPAEPRKSDASGSLPLAGLRVANFGWVWAGPMVGQVLGFLGADVIKVESRARVDLIRHIPPFQDEEPDPDRSLTTHAMWAGNGSVSLDLSLPEGRRLAHELAALCGVALENFGPGVAERFQLRYEDLQRVRSDIVLLSMPAAGSSGPLKDVRTYGNSLASLTGLDSLTGYGPGDVIPFEQPMADAYNGILGAFAILAALRHRDRTGAGQLVEQSQQEGLAHLIAPAFMDFMLNGRVGEPIGNRHPLAQAAPHGVFPCAGEDQWIAIAVENETEWRALAAAVQASWVEAEDFATHQERIAQIDALHEQLSGWTRSQDARALAERLQARGVAATPVLDATGLYEDPHFRARETFCEVMHPLGFRETIYGPYVKMSRSRPVTRPAPPIGHDNERILKGWLGLSDARYEELLEKRVIY
jgi:benzylsuccinate CoA-transferase BbsF subunit